MSDRNESADVVREFGLVSDSGENAVLAACARDREFVHYALGLIAVDMFYDPGRQSMWKGVQWCVKEGLPITAVNIARGAKVAGRPISVKFAEEIFGYGGPLASDADRYVEEMKMMFIAREVLYLSQYAMERVYDRCDPMALWGELEPRIRMIQSLGKGDIWLSPMDAEDMRIREIEMLSRGEQGVILGWPFDGLNSTIGYAVSQNLYLLSAPDGVGKSAMAMQIAEHWAKSVPILFVTLEDTKEHKLIRQTVRYARVGIEKLRHGTTDEEMKRVRDARVPMAAFRDNLYILEATGNMTVSEILHECKGKMEEVGAKAIIIDYLGLQRYDTEQSKIFGSKSFMYQEMDVVKLKHFAREHYIPVLAVAQMTKEGLSESKPTRRAIYGGARTYQVSQGVMLLHRPKCTTASGEHDRSGRQVARQGGYSSRGILYVDKANEGVTGDIDMYFDGEFYTWEDWKNQSDAMGDSFEEEGEYDIYGI